MSLPARRRFGAVVATVALTCAGGIVATGCGGGGGDDASRPTTGVEIYTAYCLTCHGVDGQGFVGPRLAGSMVDKYPNVDDQIAVVTNGKGTMPGWGDRLGADEIRKVVEFERTDLGQ